LWSSPSSSCNNQQDDDGDDGNNRNNKMGMRTMTLENVMDAPLHRDACVCDDEILSSLPSSSCTNQHDEDGNGDKNG
jgi:hypothetical protein